MESKDIEMPSNMEMDTNMEMESNSMEDNEAYSHQYSQRSFNDKVTDLLVKARHLINQGKPSLALQAVVLAVKTEGGDEAVAHTVQRARDMYLNRLQAVDAADQLASLFAECAIAEAQPNIVSQPTASNIEGNLMGGSSMFDSEETTSILAETGREQIVFDAYLDGSSFVCSQCGGLVSNLRKEEHMAYWCHGPT